VPFSSISGRAEFQARAAILYDGLAASWLTPSELFSPFYGAAGIFSRPESNPRLLPEPVSNAQQLRVGLQRTSQACNVS
jgi:hypothetical protein